MENNKVTITREEKRGIDKILKTGNSNPSMEVNAFSLILHKLHLLEEKINKIEYQTRTHWVG